MILTILGLLPIFFILEKLKEFKVIKKGGEEDSYLSTLILLSYNILYTLAPYNLANVNKDNSWYYNYMILSIINLIMLVFDVKYANEYILDKLPFSTYKPSTNNIITNTFWVRTTVSSVITSVLLFKLANVNKNNKWFYIYIITALSYVPLSLLMSVYQLAKLGKRWRKKNEKTEVDKGNVVFFS